MAGWTMHRFGPFRFWRRRADQHEWAGFSVGGWEVELTRPVRLCPVDRPIQVSVHIDDIDGDALADSVAWYTAGKLRAVQ